MKSVPIREHLENFDVEKKRFMAGKINYKYGRFSVVKSRKLAVLAEVALALARNRQAPGPLETLKLSN